MQTIDKLFNAILIVVLLFSQSAFISKSVSVQGETPPTPQFSDGHNHQTLTSPNANSGGLNETDAQISSTEILQNSHLIKGIAPVTGDDVFKPYYEQGTDKTIPEPGSVFLETPNDKSTPEPTDSATSWSTIVSEGFEYAFPSGLRNVFDHDGTTNGEYYWDDDDYKPYTGVWSAWAANGGANGLDPASYYYPNNAFSWMEYGPFDLSNANDADLLFRYWNQSEQYYDWFGWYASLDGVNYHGTQTSGDSGGWQYLDFDLTNVPTIGNVTGDSSVWIAFIFTSDISNVDDGPFVDDIVLQKNTVSQPNLIPYTPSGWDAPLVASSVTGTSVVNTLYANQSTFVDWAVINAGGSTSTTFTSCIYYDGGTNPLTCWDSTGGVSQDYYVYVQDWQLNLSPTAGSHTLTIKADVYNNIAESNENDNNYSRSFTWLGGACGPYTSSLESNTIPDDGAWLAKIVVSSDIPEQATITDVLVKLSISTVQPSDIEVELVYNNVSVNISDKLTSVDNGLSGSLRLADFSEQPATGQWMLRIRDKTPDGNQGTLDHYSIQPLSKLIGAPVVSQSGDISAYATSLYLPPSDAQPMMPDGNEKKPDLQDEVIPLAFGWNTIASESFEGVFPSGAWVLKDLNSDGCEHLWNDDDYRHYGGSWAAWPASGGVNGVDPATSKYPPNSNTWMIYGPFDLSDATDAKVTFKMWLQTEQDYDKLFVGISSDGVNFNGFEYSGNSDWVTKEIGFQSYTGDSSVWLAFKFGSDATTNQEGPWIDDIVLEKYVGFVVGDCTNGYTSATQLNTNELLAAYQNAINKSAALSIQEIDPYAILLEANQFVPQPGIVVNALESALIAQSNKPLHLLIQFYELPSPDQKKALAAQGIKLLHYIPHNAWIASVESNDMSVIASDPSIRWAGEFLPDHKESIYLRDQALRAFYQNRDGTLPLLVEFAADVPLNDGKAFILQLGGSVVSEMLSINALMVSIPSENYLALKASNEIIWIEPPLPKLEALNDCVRRRIGGDSLQAAPYDLTGSGIDLLVYDAGAVSATHPAFSGRLTIGDSSSTADHPTHVAGIAAGSGSNSPFLRDLKGMAPSAWVISYGFQYSGDQWLYTNPGDIEADWRAAKNTYGADLGTASIGTNTAANGFPCEWEGNYGAVSQLIDDIVTGSLGEPYIATWAAGNERGNGRCGTGYGTTAPPGGAKNPIHVGATNSDSDVIASFSSFGPTDDGRIKPTISAPGCEQGGGIGQEQGINSAVPDNLFTDDNNDGHDDYTYPYDIMCGTSMAAPAVAGLNALLIQQYRSTFASSGEPLPSTIKALLIHTAVDKGNAGPDYQYGYGRVDGVSAMDMLIARNFREESVSQSGEYHDYTYSFSGSIPSMKASIAWDDEPATPSATVQLVNDLDLTLISPSGQTYYPFVLNPSNPGLTATTGADHLNNQEQIIVPNPQAGTWIIRVRGNNIPVGPQRYSIVFTGAGSALITRYTNQTLTVIKNGTGSGTVTSAPAGINCGSTCSYAFAYNTVVTLTASPTAPSTFTGWSGACSGTGTCTVTMSSARSVTATFTAPGNQTLTVTKSGTGSGMVTSSPAGINCGADCSEAYIYNTSVTLTAVPAAGSTFTGWSGGGCSGTSTCILTMTAATTVTANFNLQTPTLTVNKTGTGGGTVTSNPAGINCGADCSEAYTYNTSVTLTATAVAGSTFTGWNGGGCSGTGTCTIVMTTATTVTANFNLQTPTLTVNKTGTGGGTVTSNPAGINCGADCSESYPYNTQVTLTATASTDSYFAGWSGDADCSDGQVTMNVSKTCIATFNIRIYTLMLTKTETGGSDGTVISNPAGINCGSTCSYAFAYNTQVTLTATPATGSAFYGWSGACTGTGSCVIAMTGAKSVTATFSKPGDANGDGNVDSLDYVIWSNHYGQQTSNGPSDGDFNNDGKVDGIDYTIWLNNTTVIYTLTINKEGTGDGTVTSNPIGIDCGATCSYNFATNTVVTLTAAPSAGSIFAGWGGACSGTGSCVVNMTSSKSVTANFLSVSIIDPKPIKGDFNGDGKDETGIFSSGNGTWFIKGLTPFVYGQSGDIPVPADYNGDGKDDIAVFRPTTSTWYLYGIGPRVYGTVGDIPVVADYDGDGKADIAVFRPTTNTWYLYGIGPRVYGTVGDIPVIADYNGDGKADIAVFRPTNSTWYLYGIGPFVYGTVGDVPVIADYNGDGKADIAVFRPTNSTWYIYGVGPALYGTVGDIPVIGDYTGDGKADIAVFRPSNNTFYIRGVGTVVY